MENFTGLYRATNAGVVKCRVDFAAAETFPPGIFLESLGGHLGDGETIYTRLRDQDRAVYDEIRQRFGISGLTPA
jgi:hypothetical protein